MQVFLVGKQFVTANSLFIFKICGKNFQGIKFISFPENNKTDSPYH